MKKCSEIKELISLYIDDELEVDERREFEEHTGSCSECGNELDELMHIVGLCRATSEEELPADFRIELHQKLLEVQKQSEEAVKPVFYNTKYFRLFSSVAAVFLLVFLVRGIFNFDPFSNNKTSQSVQKSDISAAQAPADSRLQSRAMTEAANDAGNYAEKSMDGVKDYADKETLAESTEIGRSTTVGRETQMNFSVAAIDESVSRNTTSITIAVDDPDAQVENIKAIAMENSGFEQPAEQFEGTEFAYTAEENNIILLLNIPNIQLNTFIDEINTGYGQSNIQREAVITEDMSAAMEGLLNEADKLDILIEKVEKGDDENTIDVDKLKALKTEIQDKIDAIRLESDLTNVKVILKKK